DISWPSGRGTRSRRTGTISRTAVEATHRANRDALTNPESCKPCTQVPSCSNPCDECELCVGQTELSAGSTCESQGGEPPQRCPTGLQACGLAGQDPCPRDYFCITGCC